MPTAGDEFPDAGTHLAPRLDVDAAPVEPVPVALSTEGYVLRATLPAVGHVGLELPPAGLLEHRHTEVTLCLVGGRSLHGRRLHLRGRVSRMRDSGRSTRGEGESGHNHEAANQLVLL